MNMVDWVVIGAIAIFAWTGWRQGFVAGLLSFAGFLGGGILAAIALPPIVERLSVPDFVGAIILAGAIVATALIGQMLTSIVGRRLRAGIEWGGLRTVDNIGGAALNVVALSVILWIVASAVIVLPDQNLVRQVRGSVVITGIDRVVPDSARDWFVGLRDAVDASGLPRVFAGIGIDAGPPVPAPDPALLNDPAVRAAWPSLTRVFGPACEKNITGSGFVYAPERIMTNAHVVAGVSEPRIRIPGDPESYRGRVVVFDAELDVAVVYVPGLRAPAIDFSNQQAQTGDSAVVAGFPGGGDLTAIPARIRGVLQARGENIYGRVGPVREVYSFRGDVRPGNSGGPLLSPTGDAWGVVFASGVGEEDTGYALTAEQVANIAAQGRQATTAIPTTACRTL
ncbi:MAG: MarP family serine protease [Candidatus Nanopelagicales bacterium]